MHANFQCKILEKRGQIGTGIYRSNTGNFELKFGQDLHCLFCVTPTETGATALFREHPERARILVRANLESAMVHALGQEARLDGK